MSIPKLFITIGIIFVALGLLFWILPRVPGLDRLGKLPGDIQFQKENFSFYFPIVTCLLVSVLLTLLFRIFHR